MNLKYSEREQKKMNEPEPFQGCPERSEVCTPGEDSESEFTQKCPMCSFSSQWREPVGGVIKLHPLFLCTNPISPFYGHWLGVIALCEEYFEDSKKREFFEEVSRRRKSNLVIPRGVSSRLKSVSRNSLERG
jgi:hypothetical protein